MLKDRKRYNEMNQYIHYGHKTFDKTHFYPIKNIKGFTKPAGGLWASKINAPYGWKAWYDNNNYGECIEDNSFKFTFSANARILRINNCKELENLPKVDSIFNLSSWIFLDFEKLALYYDAIEINISSDSNLYCLYGWDCDSLLIMNPDIIQIM